MELMDGFFDTDLILTTDKNGEVNINGYYGSYEITAQTRKNCKGVFSINKSDDKSIIEGILK